MLEEGQIVKLDNGGEYIVIYVIKLHDFNYVYLINNIEPHDVKIGNVKFGSKYILNEITSTSELEYILTAYLKYNKTPNEEVELEDVSKDIRENGKLLEQITDNKDQLDKDQILMRQRPKEVNFRLYGNDSFDRYLSHNLYEDIDDKVTVKNDIDVKASIEKYITEPKGKIYYIVDNSITTIDVRKIKNDFTKSLPNALKVLDKLLGEERPSDKQIEEEYMKRLAA